MKLVNIGRAMIGADVDLTDNKGETALHIAAKLGNVEVLKLLIEKNASRTIKNAENQTALDIALYREKRVAASERPKFTTIISLLQV